MSLTCSNNVPYGCSKLKSLVTLFNLNCIVKYASSPLSTTSQMISSNLICYNNFIFLFPNSSKYFISSYIFNSVMKLLSQYIQAYSRIILKSLLKVGKTGLTATILYVFFEFFSLFKFILNF